ncbi:MAG: hypothetical protein ACRD4F_05340 [Candidatus Angelobacter sp.]
MADALHKSSDIPNFDTYPAVPELPAEGETVESRSPLEEKASQTGSAIGKAAAAVRNIQEKFRRSAEGGAASDKVAEIADRAKARAQEIGEAAASRAEVWGRVARERLWEFRHHARHQMREAGVYARRAARDYPVQVAVGAGAAGFIVGVLLRIRRASRA